MCRLNRKQSDVKKLNIQIINTEQQVLYYRQLLLKYNIKDASSIERYFIFNFLRAQNSIDESQSPGGSDTTAKEGVCVRTTIILAVEGKRTIEDEEPIIIRGGKQSKAIHFE